MEQITITLPAIDEAVIANLETLRTQASATEIEALKAVREKYAPLAKHNGWIKIADYDMATSNYRIDRDLHYVVDGRKVKGLLCYDGFSSDHTDQNRGNQTGDRLYLTESGQWLRIERDGHWTQWQGEAQWWGCGVSAIPSDGRYEDMDDTGGSIRVVTDAEVEAEYDVDDIVAQLAKSLGTLATKLPQRMTKLQQRVALASKLLEALK
jgi:hypothetical protein